ncbi:class I SAM-dependent methyltransferase [Lipingzhangella rawalii]|uniref:class I SAM-dependent methyltransferase n=1 Tax=Lipingzhangella rawalii TaxID=2055835 RepID=UPI00287BB8FD|nr:class I SAM-dependent methyltransferase [Lipingzhangella rawalii]
MPAVAERLRNALLDIDYTSTGIRDRLGSTAARALARDELVPALRATGGEEPLGLLLRLWWLGESVPAGPLRTALPLDELTDAGLIRPDSSGDTIRATLQLIPWDTTDGRPAFVVADHSARPGQAPPGPDHVVRAGAASASLRDLLVPGPVDRALDLGTGCGVQALHLAERAGQVCATDVNKRALRLAEWTFALSGVDRAHTRAGSLYEPVAAEQFDLIAANPPFVITPERAHYSYRESDLPGDEVCAQIVRSAPAHLTDGGWCQLLANWLHVDGEDWRDRVGDWVSGTACSGWVVQRDVQDPAEYVELWLRDSCEVGTPEYTRRYDAWLDYFERRGVKGIGYGWISLRKDSAADATVRIEELRHDVEQPVGHYLPDVVDGAMTAHRLTDAALLSAHVALAPGVVEERVGVPGAADPEQILLRQRGGLRRAAQVGTVEAALAGVCDGTMPVGPLLDAIAELTGQEASALRESTPETLRGLITEGFFRVAR